MLRLIIGFVILAHGIGHILGVLQLYGVAAVNPNWQGDSWLLTGPFGSSVTRLVATSLWIAAIVGFCALAGVVVGLLPSSWFLPLAVVSSAISLLGIAMFPAAFPITSTLGALAVDVIVLIVALRSGSLPSGMGA